MPAPLETNPAGFTNPHSFANKCGRLAWWVCWMLLFRPTPWFAHRWRSWLLKRFGAKLQKAVFYPSAEIWAPWLLETGVDVSIDRRVNLYNAFGIRMGNRIVISQGCFLCTASHDHTHPTYPLIGKPIVLEDDCWIAADAFIGPGVTIGRGAVVGARAVVVHDVPPWTIVAGNPARVIKERKLSDPTGEENK